jgi:hypothetical protein
MTSFAQAAADLIADPRPVLFLDTCTLLDIVRAPLRDLTAEIRAGVELRALHTNGTVRLFVQDIVPAEWADNLPAARRDGEAGVRAFTATWQIAVDLGKPAPPLPILPPGNLIDELEQVSRDLLNSAVTLDRDYAGMSWAIGRVVAKQKPSSAKGAVKDCHILGHALQLSTLLGTGYPRSRVLVSSNRSDFAAPIATLFHPDIAPDAAAAGLRYAASLEAPLSTSGRPVRSPDHENVRRPVRCAGRASSEEDVEPRVYFNHSSGCVTAMFRRTSSSDGSGGSFCQRSRYFCSP